jgi:aerobic-type carbon monoxide dehydrogenase small subunit (CoxS/CutS family)
LHESRWQLQSVFFCGYCRSAQQMTSFPSVAGLQPWTEPPEVEGEQEQESAVW